MNRTFILILVLFGVVSCNNDRKYKVGDADSWNLLGGTYEKVGEMTVWNGYWVEGYEDTSTNMQTLLFVYQDDYKTISDSLNIGLLKDNESIHYGTVELNEKENPEMVALFIKDDSFYHKNILKAWRANVNTGKFEEFPIKGIRVKNIRQHYR